jgi:hypothetical protein
VTLAESAGRLAWTGYWQLMRRYHRFEVRAWPHQPDDDGFKGLEYIRGCSGPAMIVGYHGKPGARDMIMLQTLLLTEYGERTHAITHDMVFRIPVVRDLAEGMQLVPRDPESIAAAVGRGEKLVITPGGIQEAWASYRDRYKLKWSRLGYLKLALRYRLPIIPVAGVGSGSAFYGAYDAYRVWKPAWDRYGLPEGTGFWVGVGPLGVWPFTPPFPARISQYVGAPISVADHGLDEPDLHERFDDPVVKQKVIGLHHHLVAQIQQMLDDGLNAARCRAPDGEPRKWIDQIKS